MLRAVIAAFLAATTSGDVAELCAAQASRAAPEKLAQEQQFNSPSRCRGWPLLRRLASDVVGAATVEADGAVAFELAPCGNNATFRRSLSVFLSFYSADVRDATLATAEPGSRALRVRWRPPLAGAYDVVARLHFYGDDCDGSPPVYLGGSEPRCAPREKCKTPRLQKNCDELARVPAAPRRIAAPAAPAADAAADAPQCRDGATRDGHWRRFARGDVGPGYTGSPWDALVARSVHKADKKMAPWRFARPGCAYHYFAPGDARRALDGSLLLFVGDSLLRGLYATTVRLLGGAASDDKLKAREDAARGKGGKRASNDPASRTSFDLGGARLAYASMWSDAELGAVKAAVGRAAARGQPFARVVVVANWGAEHSVAAACDRVEAKFARQANRARDAVAAALPGDAPRSLVVATPTAMLARRNPGMTTAKARALGRVLAAQAEATRRGGAFAAADLLDLSNLTKARFDDATLDGVHYGQTAATMGATVLLNMLAARP
ncbi:hypothetical protein AURANDRAFT_63775 [Aureococcus anophagefferens]|uniref:SGNH hydrolase-type esterase domain-containing protein n=1 Tax=Aureococcus anophagefferens TaxID=44056 RepID=F0Y7R7_AURAN|nr:hypothetical protein AURANDRAFT_63775 [Aureococcus anophagefferens]EGB08844.1 hypothetical protein AURANDRAFT_63775 [Aureococcus anophagefferens]|eukprot:XP_009036822.1 hypothetical protein AURANDRAFT_63775 [Aureococcus anophagefferens]